MSEFCFRMSIQSYYFHLILYYLFISFILIVLSDFAIKVKFSQLMAYVSYLQLRLILGKNVYDQPLSNNHVVKETEFSSVDVS